MVRTVVNCSDSSNNINSSICSSKSLMFNIKSKWIVWCYDFQSFRILHTCQLICIQNLRCFSPIPVIDINYAIYDNFTFVFLPSKWYLNTYFVFGEKNTNVCILNVPSKSKESPQIIPTPCSTPQHSPSQIYQKVAYMRSVATWKALISINHLMGWGSGKNWEKNQSPERIVFH